MLRQPVNELLASQAACGKVEHQTLLFVDRGDDLVTIQDEEHVHRGMGDSLVAIQERVMSANENPSAAAFA